LRSYYVYILASQSRRLYVGVTSDLVRRIGQHKIKQGSRFTARYQIHRLVYFEETHDVVSAIAREKQLKGWKRARKVELIELVNPGWEDLSAGWFSLRD